MVIYLRKSQEVFFKIILLIFLFVFVSVSAYFIGFIKYDDKDIMIYTDVILENQRLKKELGEVRKFEDIDGIVSRVVLRDFYSFYSEIVLDSGNNDGIKVNDAVINDQGLVGVVYRTNGSTSKVKLLSSDYNISVKVGDTFGNFNNGIVTMIDKNSDVSLGDLVYTSGLDEVLGDIFIGKVVDIQMDSDNVGKILTVDYVDNCNLNYVVVKGKI